MNLSQYGADTILDGGGSLPATLYVQLHIGNPGDAGTANVAATTERAEFTRTAAVNAVSVNDHIEWGAADDDETISHLTAWDAASGGNPWLIGALPTPVNIFAGVVVRIEAGYLTLNVPHWT